MSEQKGKVPAPLPGSDGDWFASIPYFIPAIAVVALLSILFVRALPDAIARAKVGYTRGHESACDVLMPTPENPALGTLPARAPDFTLPDYTGRPVSLSSLRGNVVLVNFWATWCSTCVVEIPSMEKLVQRMRNRPFKMLAVSIDTDWPTVRKFFEKGTPLDIVLDAEKTVPKQYGTEKFPESFLIDKDGNVRYYIISDRDWSKPDVAACIESLIEDDRS